MARPKRIVEDNLTLDDDLRPILRSTLECLHKVLNSYEKRGCWSKHECIEASNEINRIIDLC